MDSRFRQNDVRIGERSTGYIFTETRSRSGAHFPQSQQGGSRFPRQAPKARPTSERRVDSLQQHTVLSIRLRFMYVIKHNKTIATKTLSRCLKSWAHLDFILFIPKAET
jgi:hypothetical protein